MTAHLLTEADLAELMQETEARVYEWRKRYRWPHLKIGRKVRYTEAQVEQILAAHVVAGEKPKAEDSGLSKRSAARVKS